MQFTLLIPRAILTLLLKLLYNCFADVHEEIASAKLTDGTAALVALIYQPKNTDPLSPSTPEASVTSSPAAASATAKTPSSDKEKIVKEKPVGGSEKDDIRKSKGASSTSGTSLPSDATHSQPPSPKSKKKNLVHKNTDEPPSGMVCARLMVANAGDQRAVLCRNGKAVQITTDHKPDHPSELNRIKQAGGFVAEDRRVLGVLALSRGTVVHLDFPNNSPNDGFVVALGDVDLNPHVTFLPDLFFMDIYEESDEFLIIACDGVWDVLTNEQAVALVMAENGDPVRGAAKLRDIAFALNSTDNISVVVYQFKEPTTRASRAKSVGAASIGAGTTSITRKDK